MGNSVSQPTEMCQYFLAISLLKDYYLDSKKYVSQFFIGSKSWSEGNEWQDSTNSLIVCNIEHHRTLSSDQLYDICC